MDAVAARAALVAARRHRRRRHRGVSLALVAGIVVLGIVSMSIGDFAVPLGDIVPALFGAGDGATVLVVQDLRFPRLLTGLLVGGAFGLAGGILQSLARNPLASPDLLGFGAGAAAAVVFVITVVQTGSRTALAAAAFGGAVVTAAAVYLFAYRRGVSTYRLILVGIGIGAVAQAFTSYLLTRTYLSAASQAVAWLAGSLNSTTWVHVKTVGIPFLVLVPAAAMLARMLGTMQLGDDVARGLGVPLERARAALLLVCVALVGVGTAAAGPIAYVAFVAPPIARRLVRAPGVALVPCALTGAALVLAADVAGQHALGTELPVGIITGAVGGAYLLWLVARSNLTGRAA